VTIAERMAALRVKARRQALVVLVWGPGAKSANKEYWEKRIQIRERLKEAYKNAEVEFSESDVLRDHTRDLNDLLVEELAHAAIADCIIVLDVSRGSHVEVDRFTARPEIAAKITLLLPERYVGGTGLVSSVHKGVNVKGFSDAQLKDCHVASEMALSIVDSVAIDYLTSPHRWS
jgi:hypothetical protein